MTIQQLHEVITAGKVTPSDLDWVTQALPSHRRSLTHLTRVDCDIQKELTTTVHVVRLPSGSVWLCATDLFRIHALKLPEDSGARPSVGSYRNTQEAWSRYPASIDTTQLIPYLQAREDADLEMTIGKNLARGLQEYGAKHPEMLVLFRDTETEVYESLTRMTLVTTLRESALPSGSDLVAMQWPVISGALEGGMGTWTAPDSLGPWRAVKADRLAITIGVRFDPADLEEVAS